MKIAVSVPVDQFGYTNEAIGSGGGTLIPASTPKLPYSTQPVQRPVPSGPASDVPTGPTLPIPTTVLVNQKPANQPQTTPTGTVDTGPGPVPVCGAGQIVGTVNGKYTCIDAAGRCPTGYHAVQSGPGTFSCQPDDAAPASPAPTESTPAEPPPATTPAPPSTTTGQPTTAGSIPDSSAFNTLAGLLAAQFAGAGVNGGGSGESGIVAIPTAASEAPAPAPTSNKAIYIVGIIVLAIAGIWYYKTHHKKG